MNPQDFVDIWSRSQLKESAASKSHFEDLCRLLDVPTPAQSDPEGINYTYERRVDKVTGGRGFADVWKKGAFAWEYKGKGKSLREAYLQLLSYREDLENPPLLIVSNIDVIEIHTNFTGTQKTVEAFTLTDLLDRQKRERLRNAWTDPRAFDRTEFRTAVTAAVVEDLLVVAEALKGRRDAHNELYQDGVIAHFLVKVVFTLYAQSSGLLPRMPFSQLLDAAIERPSDFQNMATQLFSLMSRGGVSVVGRVRHFNGSVFDTGEAPALQLNELQLLRNVAQRDWTALDPSVFGTLFERVIVPSKRSQLGAHYTPPLDILDVVSPVVLEPLRDEWAAVRARIEEKVAIARRPDLDAAEGLFSDINPEKVKATAWVRETLEEFQHRLTNVTVLDPAMGSGNFLYVTMRELLDLENEVRAVLQLLEPNRVVPPKITPHQFLGLEINEYAHEIASMVLWIGYLQWMREHGEVIRRDPILERLPRLERRDALVDEDGRRAFWPAAEFIVGNPPFLGEKRQRRELGDDVVSHLRSAYGDHVPGTADLAAYWFEQARSQIAAGKSRRAGLIATNSIRQAGNREVLRRIKHDGLIFMAWPDRPWNQDGAAVRVSIVGFDGGEEQRQTSRHFLSELGPRGSWTSTIQEVTAIHEDLSSGADVSSAERLTANLGLAFQGVKLVGPFDLTTEEARAMVALPNSSGVNNRDVVKPFWNGEDITNNASDRCVIDFGMMSEAESRKYAVPFARVEALVRPIRAVNNRKAYRERWWLFGENRPALRRALSPLRRAIVTSEVAKFRVFVWFDIQAVPAGSLVVIASADELMFGILNSWVHVLWAEHTGPRMGVANDLRYTPTTCFETFPFPTPDASTADSIRLAARHLQATREHLKDQGLTITGMYNSLHSGSKAHQAAPGIEALRLAQETLDTAVLASYGWRDAPEDTELLTRLLDINLTRAGETPAPDALTERFVESIRQSMVAEGIEVNEEDVRRAAVDTLAKPGGH